MRPPAICDVGPRDGLQNLERQFSLDERVALIERLASAGLPRIEAVSFVNPARVPQMADAEEVLARLDIAADVRLAGLVMNEKGVERALATRITEIRFVVVASETFSRRNQGTSMEATLEAFTRMAPAVRDSGRTLTGVLAAAFGCPYEGEVPRDRVVSIVEALTEAGADEICLADTIGVGVPADVRDLARRVAPLIGARPLGFHFHNTRNTGYANAWAAIEEGCAFLDASIGGLGGCPFAPNATGNIATEDLDYLLKRSCICTGLEAEGLREIVEWLREKVPGEITGHLAAAGGFPGMTDTRPTHIKAEVVQ